ncbi:MAG: phage antirepressor [Spirochaetales bacterium]|nr:phage antirepressor [Spirochaetales bacterium]
MDLQTFCFEQKTVRTQQINGESFFCLKDICNILDIKNYNDCKNRLNEKGVVITDTLTKGGKQQVIFINESNLYKIAFQSRKPEAEKFTDWVTSEVLPTIRKTGKYEVLSPEQVVANALIVANNLLQQKERLLQEANHIIESQKPKVAAHDLLINTTNLISMRICAKEIKVPEKKFITYLLENGFLYRDGLGKLIPYAKPKVNGLFDVKTIFSPDGQHSFYQTMITPEGLAYFAKHTDKITHGA